ncbi:MAG: glycosyltransferase family 2 protein [Bacteroidia bacterium]|nr:glycosyltransferase family 2 protein [Bacteroidia bacterium]
MKIAAVIPAYNEQDSIRHVVEGIRRIAKESGIPLIPVVVNDLSTDHTAEVAENAGAVVLSLPVNLGIGGAVQTGFIYARAHGFTHAIQVDGDGQHPPEAIPAMLRKMEEEELDVVIGSRFISGEGFQSSALRRLGIRWFSALARLLTGYRVLDSTSGFRLVNLRTLNILAEEYPDDYPEPEAISIYARHGLKVAEIPVIMNVRRGGESSINSLNAFYYMWKVTLGVVFSHLRKH